MRFRARLALGTILAVLVCHGESRAQWGYGYYPYGYGGYGWGGWGVGTFQGSVARGLGYFNMGAGVYNRETAIARAINTDTAIRWNQYLYLSQKEATREYYARRDARLAKDRNAYDSLLKRIQDTPTAADVQNGDALNAVLDQLSDPRIHTSALRMATASIDAKVIREIPFRNASLAVTISLAQLASATQWPTELRTARFDEERAEFEKLVNQAREENKQAGEISRETLRKIRDLCGRLKEKLSATPLEEKSDTIEALRFIKTVTALSRMLERPDINQVLDELRKIETTTVGNLLAFMHTFNLRFGPATNPRERAVYTTLYPMLDQTRDRILSEAKVDETTTKKASEASLHDFFSAMELEQIEGKKKAPPAPAPPPRP